jgi:hypothetical protein
LSWQGRSAGRFGVVPCRQRITHGQDDGLDLLIHEVMARPLAGSSISGFGWESRLANTSIAMQSINAHDREIFRNTASAPRRSIRKPSESNSKVISP